MQNKISFARADYESQSNPYFYERVPAQIKRDFPPSLHLSHSKSGWNNDVVFLEYITDAFFPFFVKKNNA